VDQSVYPDEIIIIVDGSLNTDTNTLNQNSFKKSTLSFSNSGHRGLTKQRRKKNKLLLVDNYLEDILNELKNIYRIPKLWALVVILIMRINFNLLEMIISPY
jgi:hypothetical protein